MGWSFHYNTTKQQLVEYLIEPRAWTKDDGTEVRVETLKHTVRGSHLWAVRQKTEVGQPVVRYILLCLLQADRKTNGYGYKDMTNESGPAYFDCPLGYLGDLTEPRNDWSREWEEGVRKYHKEQITRRRFLADLRPGQTIKIYGKTYTVMQLLPQNRLQVKQIDNNAIYSARRSQVSI